ncbi:VanZ family protein [Nitrincola nitratireducens]|uniref:Putative integral membrane protein n=1 Tax=Nitrincola nitratireducens TaxID=1229521 RepID=W9UU89_9GAMM|nr:VanZ family protein [Nitrincola nitratireducens]EXJ10793.1 putative integral membrane protein [Nitrincola nitratireducens]
MFILNLLRLPLFVLCTAVLLWGLLRPESPPDLFDHSDKWMHLIAFLGLALVSRFAFISLRGLWVWPLLFLAAPGLEYLQHLVQPHRTFSWADVAANITGVLIALGLWAVIGRHLHSWCTTK